jgi:hypothetical protein
VNICIADEIENKTDLMQANINEESDARVYVYPASFVFSFINLIVAGVKKDEEEDVGATTFAIYFAYERMTTLPST